MKHFSVFSTLGWLVLSLVWLGCKDEVKPVSLPVVLTGEIFDLTASGATGNGQVVSDGNSRVTERGFVYGTLVNPTLLDLKVTSGFGVGTYSAALTGLTAGSAYHIRAYAINSKGTSYGLDYAFTTASVLPTVSTTAVSAVTLNSAVSGGNVTSDGGSAITARGVCWSTNQNPTTSDSRTTDGNGTGGFSASLTNLTPSTVYYVRAYATNSAGTAYGQQINLTTSAGLVDVDGYVYQTLTIGNQIWMQENLRVTKYRNGDPIPYVTDNGAWYSLTTGAYAFYGQDPAIENIYGKLYNWYAVADARGLCPTGWHVPSDVEWAVLVTTLGGESVAGGKMKTTGTELWSAPNTGATNESGFSGLPSAFRHYSGAFFNLGDVADWWSSTSRDDLSAWEQNLGYIYSSANKYHAEKQDGFAIRCLKD